MSIIKVVTKNCGRVKNAMQSIKLRYRVGTDGILHLEIPVGITEKDLEVMVIFQPIETSTVEKISEELGWPLGFFEQTYGSCEDDPILIDYEGDFEEREKIL